MPRKKREKSALGIYHVMLRGINKQDIFFNEDDFLHMMKSIQGAQFKIDKMTGQIISSEQCTIYAYCILHNHLHLLIKEGELSVSDIMKKIEISYARYYNIKNERVGPMFQGRFNSEPINSDAYFHTAFRYIARNPVKAMEAKTAEAYPYSSWNEYVGDKSNLLKVLKPEAIEEVLKKYPFEELKQWIDEDNPDQCMDMDYFCNIKSDKEAWDILSDISGYSNPEDFRQLDQQTQIYFLLQAIDHGITIAHASRLGTLSRFQIKRAYDKKFGESLTSGPVLDVSKSLENGMQKTGKKNKDDIATSKDQAPVALHEKLKQVKGLGKQTYNRLHLIVEYLYVHGECKCNDISESLDVSNESIRKSLMQLSNENIVEIVGNGKARLYRLSNQWSS